MGLLSNEDLITSVLLGFNSAGKRQESETSIFNCYQKTLLELEQKGVDSDFLNESCKNQWVSGFVKDFSKEKTDKDVQEMLKQIESKQSEIQEKTMSHFKIETKTGSDIVIESLDEENEILILLEREDAHAWISIDQTKQLIEFLQQQIKGK